MVDDRRAEEWAPNGQGDPLPDWAGVAGQWIWGGYLFLCHTCRRTRSRDQAVQRDEGPSLLPESNRRMVVPSGGTEGPKRASALT
jgi:hypothetical protein